MSRSDDPKVLTLGLFDKRIEGDDCLMELARQWFLETGMGMEVHAGTPRQLELLLNLRPSPDTPVVLHLPRELHLADEQSRSRILDFATRFAGRVYGIVVHDHGALAMRTQECIAAAWKADDQLEKIPNCPLVFVEYAVGLEPAAFLNFFTAIPDLERISACLDIGHVAIRAARAAYARGHAGQDVCDLKSQPPRLAQLMPDVEAAAQAGSAATLDLLEKLAGLKKPLHFHLHDGHPLSTFSPFGVSDHLSFLAEIPLAFEFRGRRALEPIFGPAGLLRIVARALSLAGPRRTSFTLEIHPTGERLPLGDAARYFTHWTDKTNAEKMNHWLSVLGRNHWLLQQAIRAAAPLDTGRAAADLQPES